MNEELSSCSFTSTPPHNRRESLSTTFFPRLITSTRLPPTPPRQTALENNQSRIKNGLDVYRQFQSGGEYSPPRYLECSSLRSPHSSSSITCAKPVSSNQLVSPRYVNYFPDLARRHQLDPGLEGHGKDRSQTLRPRQGMGVSRFPSVRLLPPFDVRRLTPLIT